MYVLRFTWDHAKSLPNMRVDLPSSIPLWHWRTTIQENDSWTRSPWISEKTWWSFKKTRAVPCLKEYGTVQRPIRISNFSCLLTANAKSLRQPHVCHFDSLGKPLISNREVSSSNQDETFFYILLIYNHRRGIEDKRCSINEGKVKGKGC